MPKDGLPQAPSCVEPLKKGKLRRTSMTRQSNALRCLLAAGLVLAMQPALSAVGARILVQVWSPLTPKQQSVNVLLDDKTLVTDQIAKAWSDARPQICAALLGEMGKAGFAAGQTLRDIKCMLDPNAELMVANSGPGALNLKLAIGGVVEATSTTPTALGKYADPRFSLALRAHLDLAVSVQPSPAQTLRVDSAKVTVSDATLDSHNFSGDVLKFVADDLLPFFGGPHFRQLAESAINAAQTNTASRFNNALTPVNAKLRGPSEYVRVAVWGRPDAIVVAFGPKPLSPPRAGTMSGALRWDASKVTAPGGCDSFSISASVQTGPAPLLDPNGYFESSQAPMLQVGKFEPVRSTAPNECGYRMSGLADGWPNEVRARSSVGASKVPGNSLFRLSFALVGDGWDGHNVVPQPNALRNYIVRGSAAGEASLDAGAAAKSRIHSPADPVVNPAALAASPIDRVQASRTAPGPAAQAGAPSQGAATSLQNKANAPALKPNVLAPPTLTPQQVPSALH
jgi:hypothetical protein